MSPPPPARATSGAHQLRLEGLIHNPPFPSRELRLGGIARGVLARAEWTAVCQGFSKCQEERGKALSRSFWYFPFRPPKLIPAPNPSQGAQAFGGVEPGRAPRGVATRRKRPGAARGPRSRRGTRQATDRHWKRGLSLHDRVVGASRLAVRGTREAGCVFPGAPRNLHPGRYRR